VSVGVRYQRQDNEFFVAFVISRDYIADPINFKIMMVWYCPVDSENMEVAICSQDRIIIDGNNNMMFDAIPSELL